MSRPTDAEIAREVAESRERAVDRSRSAIDRYRAAVIVVLAEERDKYASYLELANKNTERRGARLNAAVALLRDPDAGASCWNNVVVDEDGHDVAKECIGDYDHLGNRTGDLCWSHRCAKFLASHPTPAKEGT